MANEQPNTMTAIEAKRFANKLARHSIGTTDTPMSEHLAKMTDFTQLANLVLQVIGLERDCLTAALLIRAMLRQVHSSDVFTFNLELPNGEIHQPRETD
jgi:hypothetical protein